MCGHVYILVNAAMPGMLKIGMTTRTPEERAREISQGTGVAVRLRTAISELSGIAAEVRRIASSAPTPSAASARTNEEADFDAVTDNRSSIGPGRIANAEFNEDKPAGSPAKSTPSHNLPDFSRPANTESQRAIIDAILASFRHNSAGNWLSAKHQVELLKLAYDAKLPDGRNAFPAMHGGAQFGDGPRSWDGKDRTNRMKEHVSRGLAIKSPGQNLYMLAEGVTPSQLGVFQSVVDALAAHGVVPRYDVHAG